MSLFFRRFLSTALLAAMLVCTGLSPFSEEVYAGTGRESPAPHSTEAFTSQAEAPALSVREEKDGAGINTDVVQESRLIKSKGKYRYKLDSGKYLKSSWLTIGSKTYYFNKKGYALKGLNKIGNYYYFFSSKCVLKKGWNKHKGHYY